MAGLLHWSGTGRADLNLSLQVAMGLALLVGWGFARRGRIGAHQICQTSVVVLNLVLIAAIMLPSFDASVGSTVGKPFQSLAVGVAVVHAALGSLTALLSVYVVLVAGTSLVPNSLRFRRYRPIMRTTLALWWVVIVLGLAVYGTWYRQGPKSGAVVAVGDTHAMAVEVTLSNFAMTPPLVTIAAGGTVTWIDDGGRHSVVFDDGSFTSADLIAGGRVARQFPTPGVFPYHCGNHGGRGGSGMAGSVVVTAR